MKDIPRPGEFYRHFKGKCYQIISIAIHSETKEKMVVYQALYGKFMVYVRPLSSFCSEVDKLKYPSVSSNYRFQRIDRNDLNNQTEDNIQNEPILNEKIEPSQNKKIEPSHDENKDLIRFLDAESFEEKLELFRMMEQRMNKRLLYNIASVLDITLETDSVVEGYQVVLKCLEMWERFEIKNRR